MANEPITPMRARLAAIDTTLSHAPTTRQLSVAVHALIKMLDDMELQRIKDFRSSIMEVPSAPQ
jgi:hypothetical protein